MGLINIERFSFVSYSKSITALTNLELFIDENTKNRPNNLEYSVQNIRDLASTDIYLNYFNKETKRKIKRYFKMYHINYLKNGFIVYDYCPRILNDTIKNENVVPIYLKDFSKNFKGAISSHFLLTIGYKINKFYDDEKPLFYFTKKIINNKEKSNKVVSIKCHATRYMDIYMEYLTQEAKERLIKHLRLSRGLGYDTAIIFILPDNHLYSGEIDLNKVNVPVYLDDFKNDIRNDIINFLDIDIEKELELATIPLFYTKGELNM